jgi:hypothetical protein
VTRVASLLSAVGISIVAIARPACAGPPFLTDDPEPVAAGHWEVYGASQWSIARHAASGTSPRLEVNYGAVPELQLHAIVPAVLAWSSGSRLLPTGSASRGLGSGKVRAFLPLWPSTCAAATRTGSARPASAAICSPPSAAVRSRPLRTQGRTLSGTGRWS